MSATFAKRFCLVLFAPLLAIVIAILLWRPYAPMRAEELVGTYTFDCDLVDGKLTLRANGEFSQSMDIKSTGQRLSAEGTWTYGREACGGIT